MRGAPPAVDKACCDGERDGNCEPAVRRVKESVRPAFPGSVLNRAGRESPQPIPITANRKADGTQNESSKVNERKNTEEKPVSHTFRLATHGRACRRAVPAR